MPFFYFFRWDYSVEIYCFFHEKNFFCEYFF